LIDSPGASLRLIAGTWQKAQSPVHALSEMVYADITLDAGARVPLFAEHVERAVYIVKGPIEIESYRLEEGRVAILESGKEVIMTAQSGARVMLLGGAPLDGPRHLWWNFVSSSTERIEQAKADWRAQRFGRVEGDDEFIPLPEEPPAATPVRYP
jgi:redox-sensitive bicupin YhaK (pirin superfamily)